MRTRKIIRLKRHNYSQKGFYFVTIEPSNRRLPFCKITDGEIILNKIGKIINDKWKWIFKQYNHIRMDKYVIIPDHFHAIIRILPDSQGNVWAGPAPPAHLDKRKRYSLSQIIGAFKTKSSISIHKVGYMNYKWKRSFHDRIIRDDELEIKRNYIRNNPINWHK